MAFIMFARKNRYTPPAFFLHHRPQNLGKKRQKCKKKGINAKKGRNAKKKAENARSISKFMQKRAKMQKKRQKMHFNLKIQRTKMETKGQKCKKGQK